MAGEAPGTGEDKGDTLGKLSSRITVVGSIVAAVVGLNTALTTCSNQTIARYSGFRSAVAAEEAFWKERFDDYVDALGETDAARRKAKLAALSSLADHPIPDFSEYRLGILDDAVAKRVAVDRLAGMQATLNDAIGKPESSDTEVAEARQAANAFDADQKISEPKRADSTLTPEATKATEAMVVPTPAIELSRETQVLTAGDAKGWDVDVFWCAGKAPDREADLYGQARAVADALKGAAPGPIAGTADVRLGRIRLRELPVLRQGASQGYPDKGYFIRFDSGAGEADAAKALQQTLVGHPNPFVIQPSRTPTKWYLSVFVCGEGA
jgi:hypothetical protein